MRRTIVTDTGEEGNNAKGVCVHAMKQSMLDVSCTGRGNGKEKFGHVAR
jgi:hypothetical protein